MCNGQVVELVETIDMGGLEALGSRRARAVVDLCPGRVVAAVNCPLSVPNAAVKLLFR
jgi:hypothetical protein